MLSTLLSAASAVSIDGNAKFRDASGRHMLFHGVNIVYKQDPFIPSQKEGDDIQLTLLQEDIDDLKNWGINMVRLGVMWEAVEKQPGVYDQDYLDKVVDLVNKLGENGIYTLVDMHQDVLSRPTCGEGIPAFYATDILAKDNHCISRLVDPVLKPILQKFGVCKSIDDFGYRKDDKGWPLVEDCQSRAFAEYYTTTEAFSLFRALYYNEHGLQGKFLNYWEQIALAFKGNKYVIGYDPLNEPQWSWNGLSALVDEIWDGAMPKTQLGPMYTNIYEKLSAQDPNAKLWFEPAPAETFRHSNFEKPPGGEIGSRNHVLNDHSYCSFNPMFEWPCKLFHDWHIGMRVLDADELKIPFFMTEFGSCDNSDGCYNELFNVLDVADKYGIAGWSYWQYKLYKDFTCTGGAGLSFYDDSGTLED